MIGAYESGEPTESASETYQRILAGNHQPEQLSQGQIGQGEMIYTQGVEPCQTPWHEWEMGNCVQQRIQCVAITPGKPMWGHDLFAKIPVLQNGQAKETLTVLATFFARAWLQGSGTSPPKLNGVPEK